MNRFEVSEILYQKQYIGHARYNAPYPENTLLLYKHLINDLGFRIVEADVVFTSDHVPVLNHSSFAEVYEGREQKRIFVPDISFHELMHYSLHPLKKVPFNTVRELVVFGAENKICIMLDLCHQKQSFSQLKILYSIIKEHNMLGNTIWGDTNDFKLCVFSKGNHISQVGGRWGYRHLIKAFFKSIFCKQIIMSYNYKGDTDVRIKKTIQIGHHFHFLMKVATINDINTADKLWKAGTDLIITDSLKNTIMLEQ